MTYTHIKTSGYHLVGDHSVHYKVNFKNKVCKSLLFIYYC